MVNAYKYTGSSNLANNRVEVMSGMGRCGSLHAWEQEGVVPDIQTIAKGLGGGYAPIAAILINHQISAALKDGSGYVPSFNQARACQN